LTVEQVKLFTGLEADRLTGGDTDFSAGAGVATNAGLARADVEDAKTTQLYPLTFSESAFERLKDGVDSRFGFISLQAGAFDHLVNDVLFYQGFPPSGEISVSG
jgi:hypothetical protein